MILVFLLIGIFLFISLLVFVLLLSNIKIKIEKLHISNISKKMQVIFISKLSIYVFNKFKLFQITIDDKKIKNILKGKKFNIKRLKYNDTVQILKNNIVYLEKLNIIGYLGLEDAAYTAYIVSFINVIISILLANQMNYFNKKRYKYNINPLYINQNLVNLEINCIINIKTVNIINIFLRKLKKGRVNVNERTSNRGTYAYSNE